MNLTGIPPRQKLPPPKRDKKHRQFIASLPCISCGRPGPNQCAHVRLGWYRGGGRPGDDRTVPLCAERLGTMGCHAEQHKAKKPDDYWYDSAELYWWTTHDIDPLAIAARLWAVSGDEEAGKIIVLGARTEGKVT